MERKRKPLVSVATRSPLIVNTHFKGYDVCMNTYVGCQFGCHYCYVRFFITDKNAAQKEGREEKEWGEFVRVREHVRDKLVRELRGHQSPYQLNEDGSISDKRWETPPGLLRLPVKKIHKVVDGRYKKVQTYRDLPITEARMVIGTMTDPYQPQERKERLTRTALQHILDGPYQFNKVGIFSRSPIILEDIELISKLPRARVHFSITPYTRDIITKIEPIAIRTERRFEVIKELKKAGIRVHVNVAPAIPYLSDELTDWFVDELREAEVDEFFVDPMQAYDQSFEATERGLKDLDIWPKIRDTMQDKAKYEAWKREYEQKWAEAWKERGRPETLAIWCDHISHVWRNLQTGEDMNPRRYHKDDPEDAL